jgi:flagellin-like hook-associated protein FlgL
LRLRSTYNEIEQYLDKNIPDARSWMETTQEAIESINSVLTDITYYCNQGVDGYNTVDERNTLVTTLKQLRDQIYSDGDANLVDRTIFTGYKTDSNLTFGEDEPNTKYTIIQTNTFYCESELEGYKENFEKCVTVAFEVNSDKNGEATLERVGVVREPHECKNGMPLKKVKIDMRLKIIEGGINKHFNKINRITNGLESIDYVITHAKDGGEVDKTEADKLDTKLIFMGKFEKYANKIQSKR